MPGSTTRVAAGGAAGDRKEAPPVHPMHPNGLRLREKMRTMSGHFSVRRAFQAQRTTRELTDRRLLSNSLQLLSRLDMQIFWFNLLAYVVMCVELEVFTYSDQWEPSSLTVLLKGVVTLLTLHVLQLIHKRYETDRHIRQLRSGAQELTAVDLKVLRKKRRWEYALTAVHVPPYELVLWALGVEYDGLFEIPIMKESFTYPLDVFGTLMIVRVYSTIRVLVILSGFDTPKTKGTASLSGVTIDVEFCLKGLLRRSTFRALGACLVLLILVASVNLRFFERQMYADSDLDYIWNAMYVIAITATTVGYGDIVPRTHAGRAIAISSVIVANIMLAFLVAVIATRLSLSHRQERVFNLLERDTIHRSIRDKAAVLIQSHWREALRQRQEETDTHTSRLVRMGTAFGEQLKQGPLEVARRVGYRVKQLLPVDARQQFLMDLRRYNHLCEDSKVPEPVSMQVRALTVRTDELAARVEYVMRSVDAKMDAVLKAVGAAPVAVGPTPAPRVTRESQAKLPPLDLERVRQEASAPPPQMEAGDGSPLPVASASASPPREVKGPSVGSAAPARGPAVSRPRSAGPSIRAVERYHMPLSRRAIGGAGSDSDS